MFVFILIVVGMWSFVIWNTYKKHKNRKIALWNKAFSRLAEGNENDYIYEELKEMSYNYKGSAYDLITQSNLPDDEKVIAVNYFQEVVCKDTVSTYGANKTINKVVWSISFVVLIITYFLFIKRDIHTDTDILAALITLIFLNFIIQLVLHSFILIIRSVFNGKTSTSINISKDNKETHKKGRILTLLYSKLDKLFS